MQGLGFDRLDGADLFGAAGITAAAPIWKKEVDGEGGEWVEGTPPPAP